MIQTVRKYMEKFRTWSFRSAPIVLDTEAEDFWEVFGEKFETSMGDLPPNTYGSERPVAEQYAIRLDTRGVEVTQAAASFWESYPEYREAEFEVRKRVRGQYFVVAVFSDREEGEVPALVDVAPDISSENEGTEDEVVRTSGVGSFGAALNVLWENEGVRRIVFFHPALVKAKEFCGHVQILQAGWRAVQEMLWKKRFVDGYPGDGSAEDQWSEVFGGDSR